MKKKFILQPVKMEAIEIVNNAIEEEKKAPMIEVNDGSERVRDWVFTINNYDDADVNMIKTYFNDFCTWGIFGYEIGESGTPHLQGAFRRKNPIAFKGIKKALGNKIHLEKMRGTYQQAREYCIKEGDRNGIPHEFGVIPQQGKRSDIETVKNIIKEGGGMERVVDEVNSYQGIRCGELILKYMEKGRDFKPLVMWFYGPTGTGKTYTAWHIASNMYGYRTWCSAKNLQWFEGYDAHEAVIIDDFRRDFCSYAELLLLLDRYPYRIMNKGGSRQMLAKLMIITCPKSPTEMFCNSEGGYNRENDIGQLLRRIDYIVNVIGEGTIWPWESK